MEESPHGTVARANAANCVAEMAQNNPYCQENFLTDRFLPLLLTLMEKDPEERVRLKCLYAISSIVSRRRVEAFESGKAFFFFFVPR